MSEWIGEVKGEWVWQMGTVCHFSSLSVSQQFECETQGKWLLEDF